MSGSHNQIFTTFCLQSLYLKMVLILSLQIRSILHTIYHFFKLEISHTFSNFSNNFYSRLLLQKSCWENSEYLAVFCNWRMELISAPFCLDYSSDCCNSSAVFVGRLGILDNSSLVLRELMDLLSLRDHQNFFMNTAWNIALCSCWDGKMVAHLSAGIIIVVTV